MTGPGLTLVAARRWDGFTWSDEPTFVRDGRIVDAPAADGVVLDVRARDATILPGLIDAHTHLGIPPLHPDAGGMDDEALDAAMREHASLHVTSGVTTVRDLGALRGRNRVWAARQRGAGWAGPTIVQYGRPLTAPSGHCDWMGHACRDAAEAREAADEELRLGVDGLKLMVSGGLGSQGTDLRGTHFGAASIRAVCDVARDAGVPTAAHVIGGAGLQIAARAGVTSIEHGYWMTAEDARVMADCGTVLVPTMTVSSLLSRNEPIGDRQPSEALVARAARAAEAQRASFHHALAAGIEIVAGTDFAPGTLAEELVLLHEAGLDLDATLRSATSTAAALLRRDDVGHLGVGAQADVLVVEGDPRRDLRTLASPLFVIVRGKITVDARH